MAKKINKEVRYRAVCVNCGVFIPEGHGIVKNNKNYCDSCSVVPTAPAEDAPVKPAITSPKGILKVISYLVSLMPLAGFVLGAVFYPQEDPEIKKFGRNCFIMMAIGIVLGLVFFIMMIAAGAALGGAVDKMNFGEGYF
jgi:hypothetical protein